MGKIRCRAIIIKDNRLLLIHRITDNSEFYAFPGGLLEKGEALDDCVVREVKEEFDITIKVSHLVYTFSWNGTKEYFFVVSWLSGKISKTDAEEYQPNNPYGEYNPMSIDMSEVGKLNVLPREIALQLLEDYPKYGAKLNRPVKDFVRN